uniref:Uncharacterized protein n=1 Tax=Ascaris lumbricoides TaxID=6252 RepID=A0A9J2PBK9_ASCLU
MVLPQGAWLEGSGARQSMRHGVVSCKYQVVLCFCNLQKKEVVKAEHVDVYELFRDRNRENLDWEPVRSRSQLCPMKSGKSSVQLVRMLNYKRDRIMNILIINRANDPSMNLIERDFYSLI